MKSSEIEDVLGRFVAECGGVEFVRMIASGLNPCGDQKIVAAAKATICKVQRIKETSMPCKRRSTPSVS